MALKSSVLQCFSSQNGACTSCTAVHGGVTTKQHFFMLLRCAVFKVLDKLKHQVHICLCSPIFPTLILVCCAKCFEAEGVLTRSCFAVKYLKHACLND